MKEKITGFLTLGCIFSLFFYYKVYSPNNDVSLIESKQSVNMIAEKLYEEISEASQAETLLDSNSEDINLKDECFLNQEGTDLMSFNNAFKYYRGCNGNEAFFVWNNKKYTTLLDSELQPTIANEVDANSDKTIDNHHYSLQKEMIGLSQSK